MRVSVIGAAGQLGTDLVKVFSRSHEVQSLTRSEIDITQEDSVRASLSRFRPDWVINTAAYHKVELCEENPDTAFLVNEEGAASVARIADSIGARTAFISTDYVFDGSRPFGDGYSEADVPDPLNTYGASKLAGEHATLNLSSSNIVARISSVFGSAGSSGKGGNFVEAIVSKLNNGDKPRVVEDGRMSPTYTVSTSELLLGLIEKSQNGIFHLNNSGSISWHEFAERIGTLLGFEGFVEPIPLAESPAVARPKNSTLDNSKVSKILEVADWRTALESYLVEKGHL